MTSIRIELIVSSIYCSRATYSYAHIRIFSHILCKKLEIAPHPSISEINRVRIAHFFLFDRVICGWINSATAEEKEPLYISPPCSFQHLRCHDKTPSNGSHSIHSFHTGGTYGTCRMNHIVHSLT